jgi:multiple sugar transport system permease protein
LTAQATKVAKARRTRLSLRQREAISGYGFLIPWIIGLLIFTLGPILAVFYLSFTTYPIIGSPTWIGLENYRQMFFNDPLFDKSLYNTAYYVGIRVPLFQIIAFAVALLVNRKLKGMRYIKTGIYLPVMMAAVAKSVMWRQMLGQTGLANYILHFFGLPRQNLLASEMWVKPMIILLTFWIIGPTMLVYLAGLQGISEELYEAASIDGASGWRRLVSITIPMMTPVILLNLIMDIINSFQVFTHAMVITEGGPVNASLFYVLYIFRQAFTYFDMGFASALSVFLFLVILVFTLIVMRWSQSWVHYEHS